jgi:maleylpyruvate isomerase
VVTRTHESVSHWLHDGTEVFLAHASTLDERSVRGASLLSGWTRAHVLAHMARNAEALRRLADWARTGVETPMYADPAQRAREIDATAGHGLDRLLSDLFATSTTLEECLAVLTEEQWRHEVRTAQGRLVPATEIPWLRVREVWLHTVDLGTGFHVADLPGDVVDALLDDVTAAFGKRDGVPPLILTATDRPAVRTIPAGGGEPTAVTGPAAALLGWLTGRSANGVTADAPALPELPRWL